MILECHCGVNTFPHSDDATESLLEQQNFQVSGIVPNKRLKYYVNLTANSQMQKFVIITAEVRINSLIANNLPHSDLVKSSVRYLFNVYGL